MKQYAQSISCLGMLLIINSIKNICLLYSEIFIFIFRKIISKNDSISPRLSQFPLIILLIYTKYLIISIFISDISKLLAWSSWGHQSYCFFLITGLLFHWFFSKFLIDLFCNFNWFIFYFRLYYFPLLYIVS